MNYDVIIAAIRLPDMTGYELLLKLKEILDSVPLVLMTGFCIVLAMAIQRLSGKKPFKERES